jgi:LmbE family N-acetylglucosaminyl deacetylase
MNPYHKYVQDMANLLDHGKSLPLGGIAPVSKPVIPANAPVALMFAPHPDDECIVGALALRLLREAKMRVKDVAVTQGSNRARQAGRLTELTNACNWIGFEVWTTVPNGLEKISPQTRSHDTARWNAAVEVIRNILIANQPRVILFPNMLDNNSTHVGTHYLLMDALQTMPASFSCYVVETEFWGASNTPNLMVELSATDLGDLLAALSFHVEEVRRNPYHLRLPAWMEDNVRRGAELVGGQGGAAPDFHFATLYRVHTWKNGRLEDTYSGGRQITAQQSVGELFPEIK